MFARILFYCHLFVVSNGIKDTQSQQVNDVIDTPAFLTGDVVIGGLFHIFNTKQPDRCDLDLDMYSVMEMEAVKWSLMRLNEVNFIPGVRLGNTGAYDSFETKLKNSCVFIIGIHVQNTFYMYIRQSTFSFVYLIRIYIGLRQ